MSSKGRRQFDKAVERHICTSLVSLRERDSMLARSVITKLVEFCTAPVDTGTAIAHLVISEPDGVVVIVRRMGTAKRRGSLRYVQRESEMPKHVRGTLHIGRFP